ncbi:MAG: alpha/beta fold hydrolase [Caulobacterales bacterium]
MVSEGFAPVSGGSLAWRRRAGSGPALVLSHGLTDNGACWSRFVALLPPALDVWMLDARGHGESSRFTPGIDFDPARDLAEAMDGLKLTAAVIMGHSVGAMSSAQFAVAFPERTRALMLEDPPLCLPAAAGDRVERQAQLTRRLQALHAMSDAEIVAMGRSSSPGWHPDEFPEWARAKRQVDPGVLLGPDRLWREVFGAIRAPALLLHGDAALGAMVDAQAAAEAEQLNPRIRAVRIPGAGHNVRRENLPAYAAAAIAFLAAALPELGMGVQDGGDDHNH